MAIQSYSKHSVVDMCHQSPPLAFPGSFEDAWLAGRTVLITGGASGFGAAFVRRWARAGAIVVFGDINKARGSSVAEGVCEETGNKNVYFEACDVTKWEDQVRLFRQAVKHSAHGGIDSVVASAGIVDTKFGFERPGDLDAPNPPPPDLAVLDVNLSAVAYTAHLALFHLERNPDAAPSNPSNSPTASPRDRHLLLIGSMASFGPIPLEALYGASKHGVVGLFRSLRMTSICHGVRVSLLAPYFVDTPMLGAGGRALVAGAELGRLEDVVEAATRFVADVRIVGRAVTVGPRLKGDLRSQDSGEEGDERSAWEMYPDDLDDTELFQRNVVRLMNMTISARGWTGWAKDIVAAIAGGLGLTGRR